MEIEPWGVWLLSAIVLVALETALLGGGGGLLLAWALMAFAAMIAALTGGDLTVQIVAAGITGLFAMPALVIAFRRATERGAQAAAERATIRMERGRPTIEIRGDRFTAQHASGRALSEGEEVEVIAYRGLTAQVRDAD